MIRLPLPPGTLPTLWQNDARYIESYLSQHEGYYLTADAGFLDEDGYLHIMARTDDIINVAGHRLSTGGMEQVLASHPAVAECAVVGVYDEIKGEVPVGLLVLNADFRGDKADVVKAVVQLVRDQIGPVAAFKQAAVVAKLPKTRSGKILRRTIKAIAEHTPYTMPATIDDATALVEVETAMTALGYTEPVKRE
jgi:propionyl-CoA synthetase